MPFSLVPEVLYTVNVILVINKGFGVVDIASKELGNYFPEFLKVKQECKFNNCLHLDEPRCAVKDGVDDESIPSSRYKSYVQLLEDDTSYRN